jgi:hypothetical protein
MLNDTVKALLRGAIFRGGIGRSRKYFAVSIGTINKLVHRYVYEIHHGKIPDNLEIDHIDGNPANNTIENLRAVTRSFNHANRGAQKNSTSGFKGVHQYRAYGKWMAKIKVGQKNVFLGYFSDKTDAAKAVNLAYETHFPGIAVPNRI